MLVKVIANIAASGRGTLTLDGVDVSKHLRAARFEMEAGRPTVVTLTLFADVEVVADTEHLIRVSAEDVAPRLVTERAEYIERQGIDAEMKFYAEVSE